VAGPNAFILYSKFILYICSPKKGHRQHLNGHLDWFIVFSLNELTVAGKIYLAPQLNTLLREALRRAREDLTGGQRKSKHAPVAQLNTLLREALRRAGSI
jgi:hypothetical protein